MKKSTQNRLSMYRNVLANLRDNQSSWEGIPAFGNAVDHLTLKFDALNEAINLQTIASVRVTTYRDSRLKALKAGISKLAFVLQQLGIQNQDPVLMGTYHVTRSDVERMSLEGLNIFIQQLKLDLAVHGSELTDFGISSEEINNLVSQFDEVPAIISMVSLRINERKFRTSEVGRLEREINLLLIKTIDGYMKQFSASFPVFYQTYRVARTVIDRRGPTSGSHERDDGSMAS